MTQSLKNEEKRDREAPSSHVAWGGSQADSLGPLGIAAPAQVALGPYTSDVGPERPGACSGLSASAQLPWASRRCTRGVPSGGEAALLRLAAGPGTEIHRPGSSARNPEVGEL